MKTMNSIMLQTLLILFSSTVAESAYSSVLYKPHPTSVAAKKKSHSLGIHKVAEKPRHPHPPVKAQFATNLTPILKKSDKKKIDENASSTDTEKKD